VRQGRNSFVYRQASLGAGVGNGDAGGGWRASLGAGVKAVCGFDVRQASLGAGAASDDFPPGEAEGRTKNMVMDAGTSSMLTSIE
jgi:hypothetical protein